MTKARFNQKHKEILDSFLLEIPGVVSGRMFGYPAYYGKALCLFYEEEVGIKVLLSKGIKIRKENYS